MSAGALAGPGLRRRTPPWVILALALALSGFGLLGAPAVQASTRAQAAPGNAAYAWGFFDNGQLGSDTGSNTGVPFSVVIAGTDWAQIAAGWSHTVAIKTNGTLWAWGYGLLGNGAVVEEHSPVQVGTSTSWAKVTAGQDHTLAIKTDGTLWAWGRNTYGQLGDNTTTDRFVPVRVGSRSDWASVSAGYLHSVAIKTGGTLWAWGANGSGQLGDATTTGRRFPTRVGAGTDWAKVAAGGAHTAAIKTGGTLWAWGHNGSGQVGDGTTTMRKAPVRVGTRADWTRVTTGEAHTLAIKSGGTLWAWGYDGFGQLGNIPPGGANPNSASHPRPARVGSDSNWAQVATGFGHTLAIKTGGSLWSWGLNEDSQLGNGASLNDPEPPPSHVGPRVHWTAVAAGFNHTVALATP